MKILAINGSPNLHGVTMSLVNPFLEGAREAGAETELIHIKKLKINPCLGCLNCWFVTPGQCSQKDDMRALYPKLREADIWVLASPLYIGGVSGPIKMFLDRFLPLVLPFITRRNGRDRHPLRSGGKHGGIVLVSSCGLWGMENFDPMVAHIKEVCEHASRYFAGALLRPHGPALPELMESKLLSYRAHNVFAAAREAGRQVALTGIIPDETAMAVSRNLLPRILYNMIVNKNFKRMLKKLEK